MVDSKSTMKDVASELDHRIAERIRGLRSDQALSLEALSNRSGVSRSMISLIERAESSPTAVVLEKLAAGLNVPLASLFDAVTTDESSREPVARRQDQSEWKDPESGYIRRNISPPGVSQPMQIVEVLFPAGKRVVFESGVRDICVYQQIWVLEGTIDITIGEQCHRLQEGDCLAMQVDRPTIFHNLTRKNARYAVVVASDAFSRRR